jgi:hypothetical protein
MPNSNARFPGLNLIARWMLIVDLVAVLLAIAGGVYALVTVNILTGIACLIFALATLAIGVLLYCQMLLVQKIESHAFRHYDAFLDSHDHQQKHTTLLGTIAENAVLSDWAKKVVYRDTDHDVLRDAINSAVLREDWESAEYLIQALEDEFGYAKEAEQLRSELADARKATIEERIESAAKRIDRLCEKRRWSSAHRDADRLRKLFPDNERVGELHASIDARQQHFKRKLLKQYEQASRRNDIALATRLLVELDQYLEPNEAAALRDSARDVFKAKLMQMGVEFSLAVSDREYAHAITIGQRIMREFPNSRYSREIRNLMPVLRQRSENGKGLEAQQQAATTP